MNRIVIPARLNSTRLPRKPLLTIGDKPMIQHVYERAVATGIRNIVVATDSEEIVNCVLKFGGEVALTPPECVNGTDRIGWLAENCGWYDDDFIINVQGDQPFIEPSAILQVARMFDRYEDIDVATLYTAIGDLSKITDPNTVKIITGVNNHVIYMSRAPIRSIRKHIGIYGYTGRAVKEYHKFPPIDGFGILAENLEQLLFLHYDYKMYAEFATLCDDMIEVNTPEDLQLANDRIRS